MPEQEQQNADGGALGFDVPDQDWIERDDWYVATVHLGGDDYVQLLAITGDLADELNDLVGALAEVWPESAGDINEMAVLREALDSGLTDALWRQVDKLVYRHVCDWRLVDYADSTGREEPADITDMEGQGEERIKLLKSLPIPIVARVIYGLAWHTKNFT